MLVKGTFFGAIGQIIRALPPASETSRPGYAAWYARQMACSFEANRARALHGTLPLAA